MVEFCQLSIQVMELCTVGSMTANEEQLNETWARLISLFFARRDVLFESLAELQLTPPHGLALTTLLHRGPTRMRDLAESMSCDASYITAVADRLEELGLAERRNAPGDRRARELALTGEGETVARRLHGVFAQPPESMHRLSKADREALARISQKMCEGATSADWMPARTLR
jgi:DNA-binding MarR family transcriptional regulator